MQAGVLELLEERDVGVTVQRVVDHVGLGLLILLIVVVYSVWPSGVYSSPTIFMPLAFAQALIFLFAVRGNT